MHRVTASIVNYNDFDNTCNAVGSLLQYTKEPSFRLFVVDNSTAGDSAEKLRELFPQIEVIRTEKNRGFGAGHNLVLPRIDSEYHAVINPDIIVDSDVIGELCAFFDQNSDIGIACPATFFPDGRLQLLPKKNPKLIYLMANRLPFRWCKKYREHYIMDGEDLSGVTDIEFVTGCFMFMRTGLLMRAGGFDERYFLYLEDADLTREIRRSARAVYLPFVRVYHNWGRKSAKSLKFFIIHVLSIIKYMRKWKKYENKNDFKEATK